MTFAITTLGCKVNSYESGVMSDLLKKEGYIEIPFKEKADIYIINTCTVTNTADSKSVKVIKQAVKRNPSALIIAVGCLIQNDKQKAEQIAGVDIIIGNKNKTEIVNLINKYRTSQKQIIEVKDVNNSEFEDMMISDFNKTRAFVKIQDGCDNYCSYCIIPYTRGKVSSKEPLKVLEEVKDLVKSGHKEIVLTGIHTGHYGSDLDEVTFADLLKKLIKIKGLERLRVSSIEMNEITDEVLKIIEESSILVDHMHIPLQSGNNKVLKDMNRKYTKEEFLEKLKCIRAIRPNISITTDVIFGFPGETEEEFEDTLNTIKIANFSKLHVFPYSKRDGTKSALMSGEVDGKVKKERVKKALILSKELEIAYIKKFVGKEMIFIPESFKDGILKGHTGNYILIKIEGDESLLHKEVLIKIRQFEYPYLMD